MTTPITLQALTERAREEGWVVSATTNLHLDRADWPAGTGAVLVECFDEDGLPGLYAPGTEEYGKVCLGGDKLNDRPHVHSIEGVLMWARHVWDAPDEPLPPIFLGADPPLDGALSDFDRLYRIAEGIITDDIKDFIRDQMVAWDWTNLVDGTYVLTEEGRKQLEEHG